ncbi:MAG: hypothetical protein N3C60_06820 [Calditerrivibrio sp.]|nr:hypothetical protein [Calditerrivibrio sp.]
MNRLEEVKTLAKMQNKTGGLPDYILERILALEFIDDITADKLIEKLSYFNCDAGLGCFSEGYSVVDIENVLKNIR